MGAKLIKMCNTYTDSTGKIHNVFMVISGNILINYGDFILDDIDIFCESKIIEDRLNDPKTTYDDVSRFTYRMSEINDPNISDFHKNIMNDLLAISRDYKLEELIWSH